MPVFENLFPDPMHDKLILDLLFILAMWHAYAKLRMHTSSTIERLHVATRALGSKLRFFVKHVTPRYDTKELPHDEATRGRKRTTAAQGRQQAKSEGAARRRRGMNLLTYKLHALGDYVAQILWFGSTDSYSTQPVSSSMQM